MVMIKSNCISESLVIGKKVLESFNKNFSNVESLSMVKLKYIRETNPLIKKDLMIKLKELDSKMDALVKDVYEKRYNSVNEYLNALKEAGKKYKVLDCNHRTDIIIGALKSHGVNAQKAEMCIFDLSGRKLGNHVFPVTAMRKNANPNKPETWGENASIVDAWADFVMKADEGIKFLLNTIGYNLEKTQVKINLVT